MAGRRGEQEMAAFADLAGLTVSTQGPLLSGPPSPMMALTYPLFAANVRILCDRDNWRTRGSSSLWTTFTTVRSTLRSEGLGGVYRGGFLYVGYTLVRSGARYLAEQTIRRFEGGPKRRALADAEGKAGKKKDAAGGQDAGKLVLTRRGYATRLAAKFAIDIACYPLLLLCTRAIILHNDQGSTLDHLRWWRDQEGWLSLFGGLLSSLFSEVLDEAMDAVLAWCIEYCSQGSHVELSDKMLLKASGSSVVSIFTSPINYIGVIRRCQSHYPGMLEPEPLGEVIRTLPWRATFHQFLVFGSIMVLNVRLVQWKIQLQQEEEDEERSRYE